MKALRIMILMWLGLSLVAAEDAASRSKSESKQDAKEGDLKEKMDGRKKIVLDNSVILWLTKDSADDLEITANQSRKLNEGKFEFLGNVSIRFKGANDQPIWVSADKALLSY